MNSLSLRSAQLITYAANEYVQDRIEVDELEDRIYRALSGASDDEWIAAAHEQRIVGMFAKRQLEEALEARS